MDPLKVEPDSEDEKETGSNSFEQNEGTVDVKVDTKYRELPINIIDRQKDRLIHDDQISFHSFSSADVDAAEKVLPRTVYLRVNIFDIMEIQTRNHAYKVRFYYEACWQYNDESDRTFDPKIGFKNLAEEETHESHWIDIEPNYAKDGRTYVCYRRKLTATLTQNYDIFYFPFDVQDFIIQFRSDLSTEELVLSMNTMRLPKFYGNFTTDHEFAFKKNGFFHRISKTMGAGKKYYPEIGFLIKGYRKPGYFIYSIFVPIFLISMLGLTVFSAGTLPEDFEVRFEINGSILLTLVAYKFTTADLLPKVNYLTLVDKFMLYSLVTQSIFILWSSIVISMIPEDSSDLADSIFGYVIGSIWLFASTASMIGFFARKKRIEYLAESDDDNLTSSFTDYFFPTETERDESWEYVNAGLQHYSRHLMNGPSDIS